MNWFSTPFSPSEVEKSENETFRDAFMRVLNNFPHRFPIGSTPHKYSSPLGLYRTLCAKRSHIVSKTLMCENEKPYHSERCANQTMSEQWDEFDQCVKEMGIQMEKLSETINRTLGDQKEESFKNLWELMIPIYIELRNRGYSPQDITG